ncbi:MAG TPA: cation diffusion facilitator family transporter [Kiritimatiellia bacterium]|nr:cation diffusion facilitator family transporter [Kiritimatiellia bacterium]HRU71373.1 cation diffusion facilitator family transporter [Kiritimatiellia bacterium]
MKDRDILMDMNERMRQASRITWIGIVVNIALMAAKFLAGFLGNSQAMIADAVHTFSDFATDIAVLVGIHLSNRPRDKDHAYGHGKYETLAATVVGAGLMVVGLKLGSDALHTVVDAIGGEPLKPPSVIAFWAAACSVVSKEWLYRKTIKVGRATANDSVIANAWDHRADALSSAGAAAGIGAAIFLGGRWAVMDPIAASLVSLLMLKVAFGILKDQLGILVDRALPEEIHREIESISLSFPDISYPHNLRTRTVGQTVVIDLHVRMDPDMRVADAHAVVSDLEQKLRERFGEDTITTVHIEPR